MDWAIHQNQFRFEIQAEHKECEHLFHHPARALQDRLVRRSHTDRTKTPALPDWEKLYRTQAHERRLLHQARVLSWGKEKKYYYVHKQALDRAAPSALRT